MTAYDRMIDALRGAGLRVMESATAARSQCPGHGSRGLTLAVRHGTKNPATVQVTCHAGCAAEDVLSAVGLRFADLYDDDNYQVQLKVAPLPRREPSPWDLLGDINHFCDRILQQEAIEAGLPMPTTPIDEATAALLAVDVAWARYIRGPKVYGQGGGDGYGEWSPERKAEFAAWTAEVDAREVTG